MITIYDKKERDFSRNGLGVLDQCSSCKVLEKLNGIYELKLSYPLHLKKAGFLEPYNVIKADGQLFRIYHVEKNSKGNRVNANARHIFYDLNHYFIEDRRAIDKTCQEAMEMVMEELELTDTYTVESDIGELLTQYLIQNNGAEAIFVLVNRWRGELVRDNFNIQIKSQQANDQGVTVEHGKNVIGINEKINTDEVLTGIYPVGAGGITLPEKYLINALWEGVEYPDFKLMKKVAFKEATEEDDLREAARNYLDEYANFGVNYKVDFIQLEHTKEYEKYKSLLSVKVGDTVTVKHKLMGIDFKIKVISIEKDLLRVQNTKVELGEPLYTLDQYIEELQRNVDENFEEVDQSIGGIRHQIDELGVSYTIVKELSIEEGFINVIYEVEKGDTHQYNAQYSYTTDSSGRIIEIKLEDIFSELLLKEVETLVVDATRFEVQYVDRTIATYEYTTDSSGRITGIEKIEEGG